MRAPRWQLLAICIQTRFLWVVRGVFFGFCWWGQSERCRHLSSFFLISEASSICWSIFLCWVFRFSIRYADLVVGVNLLLKVDFRYLKVGWLGGICLMPRGQQKLWVVCSRVSRGVCSGCGSVGNLGGLSDGGRCLDQWSWNYFILVGGFGFD